MHLDRVIVHTDRQSYGLSMIPDGKNNLTQQSDGTNTAPQGTSPWPHYM